MRKSLLYYSFLIYLFKISIMNEKEYKKISVSLSPKMLKKLEGGKYNKSKLQQHHQVVVIPLRINSINSSQSHHNNRLKVVIPLRINSINSSN